MNDSNPHPELRPPRAAEALLRRLLPQADREPILGDLNEEFMARARADGAPVARAWYRRHVALSVLPALRRRRTSITPPKPRISLDSLRYDARSALRHFVHRPWSFAAAVGLLGVAIGLSTAMFTIVDALVLRPAPFEDVDRLARLNMRLDRGGPLTTPLPVFNAWRRSGAFTAVEGAQTSAALVRTDAGAVTLSVARITPGLLQLSGGVRPVRGRLFTASDGGSGDDQVLISEDTWQTFYGGDPAIVGREITIDRKPVVVVGVLPAEFRFPAWNTTIWRVSRFDANQNDRVSVYVRFPPGVPRQDVLRVATATAIEADPRYARMWADAGSVAGTLDEDYARALPLLSGGVVFLFLVLCANVSSLQLSGFTSRAAEFSTRAALGASRGRLVREAFMESAVCGTGGVILGVAIGAGLVALARAFLPATAVLHSLNPLNLDARALLVTSIVGILATLASGVLPAIIATRVDAARALQLAGRGGTESPRARFTTRALLVGQIAVSCTLLVGAAVLVRSFVNLATADRGLDTRNTLYANVSLTDPIFATAEARASVSRVLRDAIQALPDVAATAWSYGTPPGGSVTRQGTWTPDEPNPVATEMAANQYLVEPDYFALYNIPILRGRLFSSSDANGAVVISERLARLLWGEMDPVGRRFTHQDPEGREGRVQFEVVGLASEIRYPSLDREKDIPQFYSLQRAGSPVVFLNVRCRIRCPPPEALRERLLEAHPRVVVQSVGRVEARYLSELALPRLAATLAFVFAATALVAASAGLFSLLSHGVVRRRREFGIRSALGANASAIRRLVWRDGLTVSILGLGLGTVASLLLSRGMAGLLYDVSPTDPLSWSIVASVLALTITMASWPAAREAVRANAVALLREE
jgi:putative ABC transport system permease protein